MGEKLLHLLSELNTEARNPETEYLDQLDPLSLLQRLNEQDSRASEAVKEALPEIRKVVEMAAASFRNGGRLIYVGAGTSGRLGVLDAAECPPTFGTDPAQVVGLIAGGPPSLLRSKEGIEDDPEQGALDLAELDAGPNDTVIGISASHRTPYTVGAIEEAERRSCSTAFVTSNPEVQVPGDCVIRLLTGPEAITGSTRMKAGTAQKMTLNMISTAAMVLTGKVYGNLMVDLRPLSDKLVERSRGMVMALTDLKYDEARELLSSAEGRVKTALLMHWAGLGFEEAEEKLRNSGGILRTACDDSSCD
ncbi:MAG: N-acetylmuramic acid 6-phosphate etherase [Candidatus Krumholzibacteria bacterium]|jgi:N-acetylmuramic acid 6-phosphate etherase|nr:N-acetylmuramic acid 6-phosphate etherase [Candidatus Krumholzibacteria bacterium]